MKPRQIAFSKTLARWEPHLKRALDASDRAKLRVNVNRYKYLTSSGKKIRMLGYQKRAVESAVKEPSGLWSGELWTGSGKSYVAAWIALRLMKHGKTIFICPNRTGMGSEVADDADLESSENSVQRRGGIIFKFNEIFNPDTDNPRYQLASINETSTLKDVHFFTPQAFLNLKNASPALFDAIVSECHTLIIDEAHHFPEGNDDLVVYGQIEKIAKDSFLSKGKKVITLTATHGRMDGSPMIGKAEPDFKVTVQEAVTMGRCPEIHGIRVQLSTKAPNAKSFGDLFDLKLRGRALGKYLQEVAAVMLQVQDRNKDAKFCAFVRTVNEAKFLAQIWNAEAKKRGYLPIAVLTGDTTDQERRAIKSGVMGHAYQGFVTCNVGSESIDIPQLEIVHLIRRTRSINLLVQSVGRTLRMYEGKRRAIVVDYHIMERKVIRACKGLADYAVFAGRTVRRKERLTTQEAVEAKTENGGALIVPAGRTLASKKCVTIANEKAWVVRHLTPDNNADLVLAALLDYARKHKEKPKFIKAKKHTHLGRTFTHNQLAEMLNRVKHA